MSPFLSRVAVQLVHSSFTEEPLWTQRACWWAWMSRKQTRGRAGRETVCTSVDGTVRDPKLSINILTCTHFITATAKPGLWLQRDPYIKIIGSQQRLIENIFHFTLRQGISFKSRPRGRDTQLQLPTSKQCLNTNHIKFTLTTQENVNIPFTVAAFSKDSKDILGLLLIRRV